MEAMNCCVSTCNLVISWNRAVVQLLSCVWLFVIHRLQHNMLLCPSLSPWVFLKSGPLSWWCHPNISSSVMSFSSGPQSFPASESFPVSQLFTSGGQNIGASASTSVLPIRIQGWFPLGLTGFNPRVESNTSGFDLFAVLGTLASLLQHHSSKASILWCSSFFMVQLSHLHDDCKNRSFDYIDLCWQSDVSAF